MDRTKELKELSRAKGASLVGVADLSEFKNGWRVIPANLLCPFDRAVSVAVKLDRDIVEAISDGPTVDYADHYRAVNAQLDNITSQLVTWIAEQGFVASAVPASFIADMDDLFGNISHKAVAHMAADGRARVS